MNEEADFRGLGEELSGHSKVRFDLSGVHHINSCGAREWVNLVRNLAATLELEKCGPAIVSQLNMTSNFAGRGAVRFVHAPYVGDECGGEREVLVEVTTGQMPNLEAPLCSSCGMPMEFDDIVDYYFSFLQSDLVAGD